MGKHIKVELDFTPVGEKPMPRGREFLVLFCMDELVEMDFDRAFVEKKAKQGPDGMVWHYSMLWSYGNCDDVTITHWAEIPVIKEEADDEM